MQTLKELRIAKGLSPEELARKAHVDTRAIYLLESGKTKKPQGKTVRALAAFFGMEPGELWKLWAVDKAAGE